MSDFLIIGADAAGLSAAGQVRRRHPEARIKVINKGEIISYGACGIPYVLSGDIASADELIHFTPESFTRMRGIPVEAQKEAVALFPEDHIVEIRDLKTGKIDRESYEKLLIGTGAEPNRLPFIDYEMEGIYNLHDIVDLKRIQAFWKSHQPRRAAIIGAGNIGLELAEALSKQNMEIDLFEIFPDPAYLWPPMVRKAVREKIEEKNIRFHGDTAVKELTKNANSFELKTEDAVFPADVVFTVVGIRPATDFCGEAVERAHNGAIVIDRRGRTSHGDIYAAGDCAEIYHKVLDRNAYFPLGSTANKMGRIAGINMAGGDLVFPGIVGTQIVKFFELSIARTGLSLEDAEKEGIAAKAFSAQRLDKAGYYPGAELAKVRIICEEATGRIIGAVVVCSGNAVQFIDPAAVAVFTGMNVKDLSWFDAAYAPPYAPVWNALISAALKAAKL